MRINFAKSRMRERRTSGSVGGWFRKGPVYPTRSVLGRSVPGVPGIGMYKFGVVALGKVERKEPSLPFRFDWGWGKKI